MKKNLFFAKAFGMIAFAAVLVSCDCSYSTPEIAEDKVINLGLEKQSGTLSESYLRNAKISNSGASIKITLDMKNYDNSQIIEFPSGGVWTIYADSIIVTTANQHKLKINYWKE